ncbi:MAG: SseB family protein [Bowdeniella nasicola]|nr:SseB family protein [Bowdeniella nasicola]
MAAPPAPVKKAFRPNMFAGDDGSCPQALEQAFDAEQRTISVVTALADTRVLLPVVPHAHPGRTPDGGVVDHDSMRFAEDEVDNACESAKLVSVELADGRHALPVFSSLATMAAWNPSARPVPTEAPRAALAAASESDGLLLLDPDADHATLIPRPAVWALAQGRQWVPAQHDPELPGLIAATLTGVPHVAGVRVEPGKTTEIRIVVALTSGLDRDQLRESLTQASERLRANDDVRMRVESMELYPTALASA